MKRARILQTVLTGMLIIMLLPFIPGRRRRQYRLIRKPFM